MSKLAILFIDIYRTFLSFDRGVLAFFAPGGVCKYEISCSLYTKQMIQKHGFLKGVKLGIKRIWSCR